MGDESLQIYTQYMCVCVGGWVGVCVCGGGGQLAHSTFVV